MEKTQAQKDTVKAWQHQLRQNHGTKPKGTVICDPESIRHKQALDVYEERRMRDEEKDLWL